jgi:hypothetical protein
MQGHPEAPCLWEKHADKILRYIGLIPTTDEPCLYLGLVNTHHILLLHQVDDFSITATTDSATNIMFDLIEEHLTIPLKRMGLLFSMI